MNFASAFYFPLESRIRRLFSVPYLAELVRAPLGRPVDEQNIREFWDASLWRDVFLPALGDSSTNIALGCAFDGLQLFKWGEHETWCLNVINWNWPEWLRTSRAFIWLTMLIPGPKPRNIPSFLGDTGVFGVY